MTRAHLLSGAAAVISTPRRWISTPERRAIMNDLETTIAECDRLLELIDEKQRQWAATPEGPST
jgi:hypothetical protein